MGMIDAIVLLTILISGVFAFYRGLVRELLGLTAWILAAFGALYGLYYVRPLFRKMIDNPTVADIVGAGCIALVILVVCTLFNAYITGKLRQSALSGLDRLLGFFFGILRGILLITIVYFAASLLMSGQEIEKYEDGNFTIPYIQKSTEALEKLLPPTFMENIEKSDTHVDSIKELIEQQEAAENEPEKPVAEPATKRVAEPEKAKDISPYNDEERQNLDDLIMGLE